MYLIIFKSQCNMFTTQAYLIVYFVSYPLCCCEISFNGKYMLCGLPLMANICSNTPLYKCPISFDILSSILLCLSESFHLSSCPLLTCRFSGKQSKCKFKKCNFKLIVQSNFLNLTCWLCTFVGWIISKKICDDNLKGSSFFFLYNFCFVFKVFAYIRTDEPSFNLCIWKKKWKNTTQIL